MKILAVDTDSTARWVLLKGLKEHTVLECSTLSEARFYLNNTSFDVVFLSRHLPDGDGFSLIKEFPDVNFVVFTSNPAIDNVSEAIRAGALGYLKKPIEVSKVKEFLKRLRKQVAQRVAKEDVIICSTATKSALERIESYIEDGMPFVVYGEKGVGKQTLTGYALERKGRSFWIFNQGFSLEDVRSKFSQGYEFLIFRNLSGMCRCMQDTLYASMMAGDVPPRLIFLFEGDIQGDSVNISPSLFEVLSKRMIGVEPLRSRKEELPFFVELFSQIFKRNTGARRVPEFSKEVMDLFMAYPWEGNVAELKETVFTMLSNHLGVRKIGLEHVPTELIARSSGFAFVGDLRRDIKKLIGHRSDLYESVLTVVERVLLEEALAYTKGNKIKAANLIGLHRNTIRNKLKKLFGGKVWI